MSRIDLTFDFDHGVDEVWAALTDREALAAWFMENDFEPRVGHAFTFRTDPAPGFDGIVRCTVLEVDPPRRLRFTWKGGPLDTTVTWTLAPEGGGTRLRGEQDGFAGVRGNLVRLMLKSGSRSLYGRKLKDHLAGRDGPDDAKCMNPATRFWTWLATRFKKEKR